MFIPGRIRAGRSVVFNSYRTFIRNGKPVADYMAGLYNIAACNRYEIHMEIFKTHRNK